MYLCVRYLAFSYFFFYFGYIFLVDGRNNVNRIVSCHVRSRQSFEQFRVSCDGFVVVYADHEFSCCPIRVYDVVMNIWNFILHVTGSDNTSGVWYGFWSGFGSDLGEIAIIGSLVSLYRRHKCTLCWRLSRHQVEGTTYHTCYKHTDQATHDSLNRRHAKLHPKLHKFLSKKY